MKGIFSDLAHELESGTLGINSKINCTFGVDVVSTNICSDINCNGVRRRAGNYHAIDNIDSYEDDRLIKVLSRILMRYMRHSNTILIVGLGNEDYVSDVLGKIAISNVDLHCNSSVKVATFAPSVESETGIRSIDVVSAIVSKLHPDIIVAVDALASSNIMRLGTCIQVTDAGINPGGGVGCGGDIMSKSSLGVPIVAVGVPLVINVKNINRSMSGIYLAPSLIDGIVDRCGKVIGRSITEAISRI